MDLQCYDPSTHFKMGKLNFSEVGQFFHFLKQTNACYILKKKKEFINWSDMALASLTLDIALVCGTLCIYK